MRSIKYGINRMVAVVFALFVFASEVLSGATVPPEWRTHRTLYGAYGEHCGTKEGSSQLKCGKADKNGIAEVSLTIKKFTGETRVYDPVFVDVSQGGTIDVRWEDRSYHVLVTGNEFSGEPIYSGGRPCCSPDAVWSEVPVFLNAETFDGYVVNADDSVAGTVQIKAGKPNKKTGVSKLTASVTMLGEKKVSIKGETVDGSATMTSKKDGRVLAVDLAADAMTGTFDGKDIVFTHNIFTAKDDESKAAAATVLEKVEGVYVAALLGEDGVGALSIDVKKKGKVKVSGTLPGGVKVSVNTQLMAKEDGSSEIPVVYSKKNASLSMVIKIAVDGNVSVTGYDAAQFSEVKIARHSKDAPDAMLAFSIDAADVVASFAGIADVNDSLLPDGVTLTQERGKWKAPKAGKVKYKNGVWDISGENHSGLKLSYKSKTGMFTGSFKVFGLVNGRLKKYSVKVSGVVVDGVGYGAATVKKPATSWSIRIAVDESRKLPDWAVGTYSSGDGWYYADVEGPYPWDGEAGYDFMFNLTVGSSGKLSGVLTVDITAGEQEVASFSAVGPSEYLESCHIVYEHGWKSGYGWVVEGEYDGPAYCYDVNIKLHGVTQKRRLYICDISRGRIYDEGVRVSDVLGTGMAVFANAKLRGGYEDPEFLFEGVACMNLWKKKAYSGLLPKFKTSSIELPYVSEAGATGIIVLNETGEGTITIKKKNGVKDFASFDLMISSINRDGSFNVYGEWIFPKGSASDIEMILHPNDNGFITSDDIEILELDVDDD